MRKTATPKTCERLRGNYSKKVSRRCFDIPGRGSETECLETDGFDFLLGKHFGEQAFFVNIIA